VQEFKIAIALPIENANQLKGILEGGDENTYIKTKDIDDSESAEELNFEWKKEAVAWAVIGAVGAASANVAYGVAANYIFDFLHDPSTPAHIQIIVKNEKGNECAFQKETHGTLQSVEDALQEYVTGP